MPTCSATCSPTSRDIVGGRAGSYERVLKEARENAVSELKAEAERLGANAVVGVDLDYEVIGDTGSMLMVSASGTAVCALCPLPAEEKEEPRSGGGTRGRADKPTPLRLAHP